MKTTINSSRKNNRTLYNYYSSKKIFFTRSYNKYLLVEKKEETSNIESVSLTKRNIAISNKKSGIVIFPEKKNKN